MVHLLVKRRCHSKRRYRSLKLPIIHATPTTTTDHEAQDSEINQCRLEEKRGSYSSTLMRYLRQPFLLVKHSHQEPGKQGQQQSHHDIISILELVFFATIIVSLFMHKMAHILFDGTEGELDFQKASTFLWLPSVFISDMIFIAAVAGLRVLITHPSLPFPSKFMKKVKFIATFFISSVAFTISLLESSCLASLRENLDWSMSINLVLQWDDFKEMIFSRPDNANIMTLMIFLFQVPIVVGMTMTLRKWEGRCLEHYWSKIFLFSVLILYNSMVILRPEIPYEQLSHTPMISVPVVIIKSIVDELDLRKTIYENRNIPVILKRNDAKKKQNMNNLSTDPMNIVLIIMESMRADFMPFNSSTAWAKKFLPDPVWKHKNLKENVTPFLTKLLNNPSALHIQHKSASCLTHKALVGMMCSMLPLPVKLTKEHNSNLYHKCLPQLLDEIGYKTSFFKSSLELDHVVELLRDTIGFKKFYSKESYDTEFNTTAEWKKDHYVNRFTIEDKMLIRPMMEWVDNKANETKTKGKEPFFMSYLTGITHWPYGPPPGGSEWNSTSIILSHGKNWKRNKSFDGLLNGIAYTDKFIANIFSEFERRSLMNSTLFVLAGDHGVNFLNRRNQKTTFRQHAEEMFDVGVTFYTENEELAGRIAKAKSSKMVQKGIWSSIDIMPTILDLSRMFNKQQLIGNNLKSIVDGRSMLDPSGQRLTFSISNPGEEMILRDGLYVIMVPNANLRRRGNSPEVNDLGKDPYQSNTIVLEKRMFTMVEKNSFEDLEGSKDLVHWGTQASKFVEEVEANLVEAHKTGQRCRDCALWLLNSLESLDQWEEFEQLPPKIKI